MSTLVINQDQVERLLTMRDCVEVMERILRDLAAGECDLPLRSILWLPGRVGALGLMPSYWQSAGIVGLKAVTFFPGNEGSELDSHQGAVLLFEAERGRLLAMVDATSITAIRTAAVSAVATKVLARPDAATLAIIGSGVQAAAHLEAMCIARPISSVRVFGKSPKRTRAFADRHGKRCNLPIAAVQSVQQAVSGADIVCTTTSSAVPVLRGRWLASGMHINAVGSSVATARELDTEAVRRCRLFVDRRESAISEAGDFVLAKKEGVVDDDHILGEIGELLAGQAHGRRSPDDVTLFKSVGLAVEDLAAAWHVYGKARESTEAASIEFGGRRREAH
ncbi:MAG: ornithine cyclodeaminase family protein [Phycisphaerae bacterium]